MTEAADVRRIEQLEDEIGDLDMRIVELETKLSHEVKRLTDSFAKQLSSIREMLEDSESG
jgi:phage host-nuclease inhibitor protein Gam